MRYRLEPFLRQNSLFALLGGSHVAVLVALGARGRCRNGERSPGYVEETVAAYMKGREILIRADVGVGGAQATVWTCDLTHDYISINADYRS